MCSPLELCLFYFDQKYSEVYLSKKSHFISIKFSCLNHTVKSGSLDFSQGSTDGGLFLADFEGFQQSASAAEIRG